LRILHVIPHYYPAVRYGGPIRSVHGLAAASAALGNDVHVYTTNVDGPRVSDVPVSAPVDRDGVKVWYFPSSAGRRVYRSAAMSRALDAAVASFDIVHIHYVWVWPTVAAAAAARSHGVPYVLAPRGMLVADLIRRKSMFAKRLWLTLFARRDVEQAAAIHVTSAAEEESLRALGLSLPRVCVIENGIDAQDDEASAASASPIDRESLEAPYILFLGRISWKKGLDRLLRALASVKGADLKIAGYDENGYSAELKRLARELGVEHRVQFVGPAENEAKQQLLRRARCFVLPSYNENFGMAVLEAMAAGCPVVVSEEVGLAEVVRESGSGLVTAGDPEPLARAVNALLASPAMRAGMAVAGRRTVRERFGWPRIATQMQALYAECASGRRGEPLRAPALSGRARAIDSNA
jgi:glycosyltransferase involved in cell wall biosynthesis